jgi:hypothetical protein
VFATPLKGGLACRSSPPLCIRPPLSRGQFFCRRSALCLVRLFRATRDFLARFFRFAMCCRLAVVWLVSVSENCHRGALSAALVIEHRATARTLNKDFPLGVTNFRDANPAATVDYDLRDLSEDLLTTFTCINSASISCGKCCGTSERLLSASPIAARTANRAVTFV